MGGEGGSVTAPHWPAMMRKQTAISYCDLSEAAFEREIAAGRLPDGILFGGKPHWYKAALDKALAVIAGEASDGHRSRFEERRRNRAA